MDPIYLSLEALRKAGIDARRVDEPWLELYTVPGFPELTRNQLQGLASERGDWSEPSPTVPQRPHIG